LWALSHFLINYHSALSIICLLKAALFSPAQNRNSFFLSLCSLHSLFERSLCLFCNLFDLIIVFVIEYSSDDKVFPSFELKFQLRRENIKNFFDMVVGLRQVILVSIYLLGEGKTEIFYIVQTKTHSSVEKCLNCHILWSPEIIEQILNLVIVCFQANIKLVNCIRSIVFEKRIKSNLEYFFQL